MTPKKSLSFLTSNGYINQSVQKAGILGAPGCIKHISELGFYTESKERERWLGSSLVRPCQRFWICTASTFAMEFFWIPPPVIQLMMDYNSFTMRFTTESFTTDWQKLEIGIAAGCTISVTWFILSMEVILCGTKLNEEQIAVPKKLRSHGWHHNSDYIPGRHDWCLTKS